MSQMPSQGPVIETKPQPNIYTLLMIVAILALIVAISVVLYNLMAPVAPDGAGYGLTLKEVFRGGTLPK